MQSYSALADSAHAPVVVRSFFAAQHPNMVASSGAQRLTAAAAGYLGGHWNNATNPLYALFFGRTLSFWICMLVEWGDVVTIDRTPCPRRCQPPSSTRTTLVRLLSLRLPFESKCTIPAAVKRILQEAKELASDKSTDYTAAPLEVCPISSAPVNKHSPV